MKKIVSLSFLILSINFATAKELSIAQAVAAAKKNRPNLQALDYKIREAKLKVKEAWSGYLPQLQLTSSYDKIGPVPTGSPNQEGLSSGVSAQQLIYQFGGPQQQAKIAQAGVEIAQSDKATQEAALVYEVTKNFIDGWVVQQQQGLFEQLDLSSKRLFARSKKEHAATLLDKHEFFGSVETRATAHEQVAAFHEDAALAQAQLAFLLGNQEKINLVNQASGEITTLQFTPEILSTKNVQQGHQEYINRALKNRPEIMLIDQRITLEQQNAKLATLSNMPKISLIGSANRLGATAPALHSQYAAGISLSWPVFDGNRSHYLQQQANARATAAMLDKEQLVQQITFEVEQAYRLLSKSLLTNHSQRIAIKRAEALFARRIREHKLGMITQTTLEESRYALLQTKNRWLLAQADVAQKTALLNFRTGELG